MVRNYLSADQTDWNEKRIWILFAYNIAPHQANKLSLLNLIYGAESITPSTVRLANNNIVPTATFKDLRQHTAANSRSAQDSARAYHDKTRLEPIFQPMDVVMTNNHTPPRADSRKQAPMWNGPRSMQIKNKAFQDVKRFIWHELVVMSTHARDHS